jgi:hypothetical protein
MSPIVGGLSAQMGIADETTFGTPATVTRFTEFNDESIDFAIERIESKGLRPARRVLSTFDWLPGHEGGAGDINMEVNNQGMGLIFKHMMGSIASSQPNAGSFATVWEHKATVGPLDGKSFTLQLGKTGNDGVTRPFTYGGCKIAAWAIEMDVDGILMLKLTLDISNESTAVGLASASYATALVPLVFTGGAVTINGVANPVTKFAMTGDNGLKKDRYFIQATNPQDKKEQFEGSGLRAYGGTISAEFGDLTLYNLFKNGTVGALTAFFNGATIGGSYKFGLEITCAAIRVDGKTPNVSGPDVIAYDLPFKVLDSAATDGPVAMVYRTTDTTP